MITRLAKSSLAQDLPRYRSMLAGNDAYIPTAFESIASSTTSGVSTLTFSSIPSSYQHLQLRYNLVSSSSSMAINIRVNGDTGSNYWWHILWGRGSTVGAGSSGSAVTSMLAYDNNVEGTVATYPNVGIIDIHDYASTTKNKTLRAFTGADNNGGSPNGMVQLISGNWNNSSTAINSITIFASGSWTTGSTFALYGILGA